MTSNLPNETRKKALTALLAASLIWGVSSPIMKLALAITPVSLFAFLRFGIAALIILLFRPSLKIDKQDWPALIVAGLSGVTFNIYFFFYGLTLTSAINAGIIIGAIPIFTLVASALFLKEKITANLTIGSLLGVAGLGVIIFQPLLTDGFSLSVLGNLLLFVSALFWVVYEIVSKKLFAKYSAATITFYSFLIGAFTFMPLALRETFTSLPKILLAPHFLVGVVYGIFLTSLAGYFLWQWGLSKLPASKVGFFFYLDPIIGTIAAVVLLREAVTTYFLIGSILIFLGLYAAERKIPYHHHAGALK